MYPKTVPGPLQPGPFLVQAGKAKGLEGVSSAFHRKPDANLSIIGGNEFAWVPS